MSLIDTLSSMLGKQPNPGSPNGQQPGTQNLAAAALELINSHPGGLNGLLQKFQQGGLGEVASSWVGTGANQTISSDALHQVLGSETVTALASKAGIDPTQASTLLAQVLPHLVNGATPNGEVPATGQIDMSKIISTLAGLFGGGSAATATTTTTTTVTAVNPSDDGIDKQT